MRLLPYLVGMAASVTIMHGNAQLPIKDARGNAISIASKENAANYRAWMNQIEEASKSGVPQILVNKADRTLTVYKDGKPIRAYPISLGKECPDLRAKQETAPQKVRKNFYRGGSASSGIGLVDDGCTPEGVYDIDSKNHSGWFYHTKTLAVKCPNWADIQKAYGNGDITRREMLEWFFKRFFGTPPSTALGSVEGIQGHSNDKIDKTFGDWTHFGGIALNDADMNELFGITQAGKTKVGIIRYLK